MVSYGRNLFLRENLPRKKVLQKSLTSSQSIAILWVEMYCDINNSGGLKDCSIEYNKRYRLDDRKTICPSPLTGGCSVFSSAMTAANDRH